MKISEGDIQQVLIPALMKKGHNFVIPNTYFWHWECDLLSVTRGGYIYEYEIKTSKSDFRADFKKKKKHEMLESYNRIDKMAIPNRFFYVSPEGLLTKDDVPPYAGIIHINKRGKPNTVKRAPYLHKCEIEPEQVWTLGKTQMWRLWKEVYAPNNWKLPSRVKDKFRN